MTPLAARCNSWSMRMLLMLTIVAFHASVFPRTSLADNWPGWRGPERTGVTIDRGAPTVWSATENVRWKTPLPGSGISNPIVWNDRVICTSSDGARQQDLHVVCLDRETGVQLWHA